MIEQATWIIKRESQNEGESTLMERFSVSLIQKCKMVSFKTWNDIIAALYKAKNGPKW